MTDENEETQVLDQVVEQAIAETTQSDHPGEEAQHDDVDHVDAYESKVKVPLSALQKERKKRQELEMELNFERRQRQVPQQPEQEDTSKYESATRAELSQSQAESIRIIEERLWIRGNPDKYEKVNEYLPEFLKQRPNLATAINAAQNRYEEAFILMEALTPKQKQQLKTPVQAAKKEAPNSPTGVPKAAALNEAVDIMNMNDNEFASWRAQQKRRKIG